MESSEPSGVTLEGLQQQLQSLSEQCRKYSEAMSADTALWRTVADRLESIEAYLKVLPEVPHLQELSTMRQRVNLNTDACQALLQEVATMREHYSRLSQEYHELRRYLQTH